MDHNNVVQIKIVQTSDSVYTFFSGLIEDFKICKRCKNMSHLITPAFDLQINVVNKYGEDVKSVVGNIVKHALIINNFCNL